MVVKNHLHSSSDVHNSRVGHNNQSKKHLNKNFLVEIKLNNRKKSAADTVYKRFIYVSVMSLWKCYNHNMYK